MTKRGGSAQLDSISHFLSRNLAVNAYAAFCRAVSDLCRKHGFSDARFYKWRPKFGGMDVSKARRLRDLEGENNKLKKLLAEAHLDIEALNTTGKKNVS